MYELLISSDERLFFYYFIYHRIYIFGYISGYFRRVEQCACAEMQFRCNECPRNCQGRLTSSIQAHRHFDEFFYEFRFCLSSAILELTHKKDFFVRYLFAFYSSFKTIIFHRFNIISVKIELSQTTGK